jgi:PBP1b-binding outer membrane lipoprotein LpoB
MKRTLQTSLVVALCAVLWSGCETTSPKVVEGPNKLTTMQIDTQDFAAKADEMIASLVESGVLDKGARKPAILVVGRIVNNTTRYFDTDLLAKKIRVALNKSGKAITDVTGGALNDPDFTLSGKIIESRAHQGNVRQSAYTFQLSLSNAQGLAAWEDEKEITKQGVKSNVGF